MAKLIGPLHSLAASGTIAGTLTVLSQFGTHIAKKKPSPGGQPSAAQLARRATYRAACNQWRQLSQPDKAAWTIAAQPRQITAFNAFVSHYMLTHANADSTVWDNGTTTWDNGTTTWDGA